MLRTNVFLGSLALAFALACTPDTDLKDQPATAVSKGGSDAATSPPSDPLAGVLVEPPPGSADIPPNIAAVVLRFTEAVQSTGVAAPFLLRPATGDALPVALGPEVDCTGACYRLPVGAGLAPATLYTLEAVAGGLQFLDGKPTPAGSAGSFTTANTADVFAPRVLSFTVALAEGCLSVHVATDEVVRAEITVTAGDGQAVLSRDVFASAADFGIRLPDLPTNVLGQATLRVFDRAGNTSAFAPVAVQLPPKLPALAITEVLANPAGSETTQEFVEIYNRGNDTLDLGGLLLADKTGSDVLPQASLAAGAYAVIVPEGYAADGKDPAPQDGTVVVRVTGRLGSDGLSNAGEVVRLLTAEGDVISQYGGWVDVSATAWSGKSVKRLRPDACDAADAWSKSPSAPTPGW
jgi:hypothetical protein